MSALEEEIIEKFRQLEPESRVRLLSTLQAEAAAPQMSVKAWLAEVETLRGMLKANASELVDEDKS